MSNFHKFQSPELQISPCVSIWNTPGHDTHDISVIVKCVPGCGTVAVVGRLSFTSFFASFQSFLKQLFIKLF